MNRKLLFLPIFVLSLFLISSVAKADVVLEDIRANNMFNSGPPFNQATIESGSGILGFGEYELIVCATVDTNAPNTFSTPTPNGWNQLDNGSSGTITHSIWGRSTNNPDSEEITCSWQDSTTVFAAGSFRYAGVDADPIIGEVACEIGDSVIPPTAPSINTEAGSQVVFVWSYGADPPSMGSPITVELFDPDETRPEVKGVFFANAFNTSSFIATQAESEIFDTAGPTGERPLSVSEVDVISWRACTIGLRMGPPPAPTEVPTMSEWGLISFAAFTGIAGIWYLRRRQATA